jgi:hypothetical protein
MSLKNIERLYNEAFNIALSLIEKEARKILKEHSNLEEFVMCMGSWNFWYKNGEVVPDNIKYLKPIQKIFDEWDNYLKLTGTPMRFTANSPIRTDW